jgi:hypothetical protein
MARRKNASAADQIDMRFLSDAVERLTHLVQDLSKDDRADFFWWCKRTYYFNFNRTNHQDLDRPWKDRRNGFSIHQKWLLAFLDGKGRVAEKEVLKARWPLEYRQARRNNDRPLYKTLQDRLRQQEWTARKRLRLLGEDWILKRPCRGHLELHLEQRG